MHYRRWHRHGTTDYTPLTIEERYLNGFIKKSDNECWEWNKYCFESGYGQFSIKSKATRAHRFGWEFFNKKSIPKGMFVLHKCDNRKCQNPNHLFIGSQRDNVLDMINKGRDYPSRWYKDPIKRKNIINKMIKNHWAYNPELRNVTINKIINNRKLI